MNSLFKVTFNWGLYFLFLVLIRLLWIDLSWFGFFALAISLHQFLLLFYSLGFVIPVRYLAGSFMCLQMLVGPTFAYAGLDAYQDNPVYHMKIPEVEYFFYVLPATISFIIGLHITAGKLKGEVLDRNKIAKFVDNSGNIPYIFIALGFLATILSTFFGAVFGFVFTLLSTFKFIGAFMLILGKQRLKTGVLVLVFGSIILSTLEKAMFHDLLTWIIMLGAVFAIKFKPSILIKAAGTFGFILLAVIIQQVKGSYREAAWGGAGGGAGISAFENVVTEKNENEGLFSSESLARSNLRINQGFIITNIMSTVPDKVPFTNGAELMQILEAAFLPRVIAPNKLKAGDRFLFMKYTGMSIMEGTSMGLSSVGDAYVNFGKFGGCLFMFGWGFMFCLVLNGFHKFGKEFPFILIFTPLVFYYPIRPDCELQTSMGHMVKACVLIYIMLLFWRNDLNKISRKRVYENSNIEEETLNVAIPQKVNN